MSYALEYQIKQFVAIVKNCFGDKFMVFKTGNSKYYLFSVVKNGIQIGVQFPVLIKDLNKDIKKMLNCGCGNTIL